MPLDLVNQHPGITAIRDGVQYDHKNPFDMSLFEQAAIFERVPALADVDGMPRQLHGFSAIYNRATGQTVSMRPVPDSYNLVPHQAMLTEQAEQLRNSPLGREHLYIVDRIFEAGKKAHRTIYFPNLKAEVRSRSGQDSVMPRLDVFNSIDMSWSFQVFSGAYRDLCRNTLVFGGQKAYHQKRKHTRNLDPAALTGKAVLSLDMFTGQREQMDRWASLGLSSRQFRDILEDTLCKRAGRPSDRPDEKPVNRGLLDYMLHQFEEESKELGETMWAGYNALTHWSTHTLEKGAKKQRQHDIQRQRSDRVRDVLTSDGWQVLEGVAA